MRARQPDLRYFIGSVAILTGALLIGLAYNKHPDKRPDVEISLLVGLAVLSCEIFIIYIVVDQLFAARDRKKWQYAYTATSRVLATCFVDIIRLLYLTTTATGDAERKRLSEFLTMTDDHLQDLRSYIEGFASILDDDSHAVSRRLEAKLRWLYRSLSGEDQIELVHQENQYALDYFTEMCTLSRDIFDFIAALSLKKFEDDWREIKMLCEPELQTHRLNISDLRGRRSFMNARFACQSRLASLLSARGILGVEGPMIRYDVDGSLGLRYFLIDKRLLDSGASGLENSTPLT